MPPEKDRSIELAHFPANRCHTSTPSLGSLSDQPPGRGGSLANIRPPQAKLPPKYPRKVGDLAGLKRRLWWGILQCTYVFEAEDMPMEMRLKAAHALSQVAMTFMKAVEVADLEARLQRLEGLLEGHARDA
jgi:hypothetical protein